MNQQGITLIEIFLTIAILGILVFVSAPLISQAWYSRANVEQASNELAACLREARLKSVYSQQGGEYGVYLEQAEGSLSRALLYRGAGYDSGEILSQYYFNAGLNARAAYGNWPLDLHFAKFTGSSSPERITLASQDALLNYTIIINEDGHITKETENK